MRSSPNHGTLRLPNDDVTYPSVKQDVQCPYVISYVSQAEGTYNRCAYYNNI